jgi:hypothetical protein
MKKGKTEMKGNIKRKSLIFIASVFAVLLAAAPAYAEINRGDVLISGADNIGVAVGGEATITVDPYTDMQLYGCRMPECPDVCGETSCIVTLDGGNARSNNMNCSCNGVDDIGGNSLLEPFDTSVSVSSSDAAVASASYDGSGNISVKGLAAGVATISVTANLREWTGAQKTVAVTVTGASGGAGENSGGGSGGSSSGGSGGGSGGSSSGGSGGGSGGSPSGGSGGSTGTVLSAPAAETAEDKADADEKAADTAAPAEDEGGYKAPPATVTAYFDDVSGLKEDHWASEDIYYLANRGIVNGKEDHRFAPDDPVTRAEFVKILSGVAVADVSVLPAPEFGDVAQNAWYAPFVAWASENGVASGSGGDFRPGAHITRQDMAVMIHRFLKNVVKEDIPAANESSFFDDDNRISDYAKEAVLYLRQAGVINGAGGNIFSPGGGATRAEAATMLAGLMRAMEGE